jgi:hypothetical protein
MVDVLHIKVLGNQSKRTNNQLSYIILKIDSIILLSEQNHDFRIKRSFRIKCYAHIIISKL